MSKFMNTFHTLHTKLGIKDSKQNLVLKYHGDMHTYIQTEMDFLNISSLGSAYQYVVKIEQKFRHQNKWKFRSANLQQPKHGKDGPNQHPLDNQSKTQGKKAKGKTKNDTGKWCGFQKIPWHKTDECFLKKELVVEVKYMESNPDLESDP
jgi:hypothetical protein